MRSIMRNSFPPAVGLLALLVAGRTSPKQDAPKPPPKQEAPKPEAPPQEPPHEPPIVEPPKPDSVRISELEDRVRVLEKVAQQHEADLLHLLRLSDALASGAESLGSGADKAKEHGFEFAGPNPAARTDLLVALKAFSEAVHKAVEPPSEDDKDKEKEKK